MNKVIEVIDVVEIIFIYLSAFGLCDLFIKKMKFSTKQKILFYSLLGIIGVISFFVTLSYS